MMKSRHGTLVATSVLIKGEIVKYYAPSLHGKPFRDGNNLPPLENAAEEKQAFTEFESFACWRKFDWLFSENTFFLWKRKKIFSKLKKSLSSKRTYIERIFFFFTYRALYFNIEENVFYRVERKSSAIVDEFYIFNLMEIHVKNLPQKLIPTSNFKSKMNLNFWTLIWNFR